MSASSRVWGRQGDLNTREAGRSRENCAGAICTPRQRRRSGDFVAEVNTPTRIGNSTPPEAAPIIRLGRVGATADEH